MNKILFIASAVLLLLLSCNNNSDNAENSKESKTDTQKVAGKDLSWIDPYLTDGCILHAQGMRNFLIPSTLSDSMIKHFDTTYKVDDSKKDIKAMSNSYWIDSCTISAIADFLRQSKMHSGVRIYFGCSLNEDPNLGTDQYKKRTTIFIFPTKERVSPDPIKISEHEDDLIQIPANSCPLKSEYLKPASGASPEIGEFNKVYRKSTAPVKFQKDSLSQAVWVDSCVIYFIQKTLRSFSSITDGVNIRTAAYFDNYTGTVRGRFKPNQSTIIIVPSSPDNNNSHIDNWEIIDAILSYKSIKGAGLNHGELCPQICN